MKINRFTDGILLRSLKKMDSISTVSYTELLLHHTGSNHLKLSQLLDNLKTSFQRQEMTILSISEYL